MSKVEIGINEHSLDNSGDGELLGMVDEGSFESGEGKAHLVSQSFLDNPEDESSTTYNFRDITGGVTYRFVQMSSNDDSPVNTISTDSPTSGGPFFVIGNPVEVFGAPATQKKAIRREPLQAKAMTAKKRDDKRRATHNEVERRRRDKINSWITKLAALVPNTGLPDSASKGGILAKACDYITDLTDKQKRFDKIERDNEKLVLEVLKLNEEVKELMRENTSLRTQLADKCIVPMQRPKLEKS